MRTSVFLALLSFVLVLFGLPPINSSKAHEVASVSSQDQIPGTRCTRLPFPEKKKSKDTAEQSFFGSRCARLTTTERKGEFLPNRPPNVGIASSTSSIGPNAGSEVRLRAIACDSDGDSLLYTYSTTGGRITGEGADAVWDLSGAGRPGSYTVTVEVDDGCGCIAFSSADVVVQ